MTSFNRRRFLEYLGSTAATTAFMDSIARARALPAHSPTGTIDDVQHVVFLMQENRAFDHYFGTLRGVRGFGDPQAARLPSGKPVWYQPNGDGFVLPYCPPVDDFGMRYLVDTPHYWDDTQAAWNGGKYDRWVPNKTPQTMTYYTRRDIPFHYALADNFTICDSYHCSFLGSTDPNRYHMWTGWIGNDGRGGGPVIDNAEKGYGWTTYPERLERAGVSWKIYQDIGIGLDAAGGWGDKDDPCVGNYGDNSLLYFHQYRNALPGQPLYEKARRGTNIAAPGSSFDALFDDLRKDVRENRLPQVSWIVAPEAFSEHGNWPANHGAWYISRVLDALTSNPESWSRTALFVTYDENDGFFDHVIPPTPSRWAADGGSTVDASNEIYPGDKDHPSGPYGLGVRVPMIVVSPWSKGGWVCSEVFDHTSLIRFLERRFAPHHRGLMEPNITKWRRAICGDLTTAFDFATPNAASVQLPEVSTYVPQNHERYPDYVPQPPADQVLPRQEPGQRPARALPYELEVVATLSGKNGGALRLKFLNHGKRGACFQVRAAQGAEGPWSFTVEGGKSLTHSWLLAQASGRYDFSVHGPNGFLRRFRGLASVDAAVLDVRMRLDVHDYALIVRLKNRSLRARQVTIANLYDKSVLEERLEPGRTLERHISLKETFGWYDVRLAAEGEEQLARQASGHLENGQPSMSDPAFGA